MKRIFTLCIATCTLMTGFAQTDSTKKEAPDTIKVGGMVIIREKGKEGNNEEKNEVYHYHGRKNYDQPANLTTNWFIFDIGFSNYSDLTNASSQAAQDFAADAYQKNPEWTKILTGKSRNVNIWIVMQRLNMIKHIVNLKYGLGLELNNYFYDDTRVRYNENPTKITMDEELKTAKKNKLAADYLTLPMMVNFNFTPERRRGFGVSVGVSAGLLYSARQKTKMNSEIDKLHGDFDLEPWKVSYVAEILLGPVQLYGSYATKSMWNKGLDQTPYTVGFRIASW